MRYTTRPLSDRTWLRPSSARIPSRFDSTWSATLDLLDREVFMLDGRDLVIEVDVREQDIRVDGQLYAKARAETPAVVVAFESAHGPMLYRCDQYDGRWGVPPGAAWKENVRAVAKTLEALRAVDRYGATETGQQYAGFKALPGGQPIVPAAPTMTRQQAVELLGRWIDRDWASGDPSDLRRAYRLVRADVHPDRHGGDQTMWDQVEEAARVLGVTS